MGPMRFLLGAFLAMLAPLTACSHEAKGLAPSEATRRTVTAADAGVMTADVPSETFYNPCPASVTTCLIMPLGDSITAGAGDEANGGYRGELYRLLQKSGRAFDFVGSQAGGTGMGTGHEGHPGAHISLFPVYVDTWLPQYKPHVVLVMVGTNDLDLYIAVRIADYAKLLDQMTRLLPQALFVVAAVTPLPTGDDTRAVEFNRQLLEMVQTKAASGMHLAVADMHSAVQMRDIQPASVHPVHSGYVKMAGVWNTVLDRFMRSH